MSPATFQSVVPSMLPFPVPGALRALAGRVLGIDEIANIYEALRGMGEHRLITERLLDFLGITYTVSAADLAAIPASGAAILTVNHPFGLLDGAVLATLLARLRPDVRFLANPILNVVPELDEWIIPANRLRCAVRHLGEGGLLVIFPAGEVSHFRWQDRAVTDAAWNPIAARLVEMLHVAVVPAYVEGTNSTAFQVAGALRTALLARELLNKRGRQVEVRVGTPVPPHKLLAIPTRERAGYLRWRTYLLARRERFKPHTSLAARCAVTCQNPDGAPLAREIAALTALSHSSDLHAYVARAAEIPTVLREIGRLREITFRAAGEGTGKALDLDEFDPHYLHLFVWNARKQEVVGAYRLAPTDTVRQLYTASLFRYGAAFLDRLGPALELGRSFVRQEYQRGFAPLLLLWKGIGAFVAAHPQYKMLFGPVSISNRYQAVSREVMLAFLEKYAMLREWSGLVRNRRAPGRRLTGAQRPVIPAGFDIEDLSVVVSELEPEPAGIPVLLRQYLKLGGKLLGFSVDPNFADALDGLILVDLTQTEPKLLERYLGREQAHTFFEFQKGNHANH